MYFGNTWRISKHGKTFILTSSWCYLNTHTLPTGQRMMCIDYNDQSVSGHCLVRKSMKFVSGAYIKADSEKTHTPAINGNIWLLWTV